MNESITVIPMTPFEAYLTTISGEHVCKPTKYESIEPKIIKNLENKEDIETPEPPLPEIYCEVLLRFVEKQEKCT